MHKAFTLVELVFVIIIMAIMSMFAADLYTKIYLSYTQARAVSELEAKTEIALNIIAGRLEDRIKDTTIGRMSNNDTFVRIDSVRGNHDILEWLSQSVESRNLNGDMPGWSGYIDLGNPHNTKTVAATNINSAQGRLVTPGSNLIDASAVMNSLMVGSAQSAGIIFKNVVVSNLQNAYGFDIKGGYMHQNVAVVNITANHILNIINYPGTNSGGRIENEISEQYYLSHTAYAVVPEKIKTYTVNGKDYNEFTLTLRYNYQPWQGQNYKNAPSAIIAENVTMFRFTDDNGALTMKLCIRDGGKNFDPDKLDLIICKSQVVF